jgi:hypothetical protein
MEWSSQMPPEAVIFTRSGLQAAAVKDGNAELRNIRVTRDLGDAGASRRGSMGHLRRKVDGPDETQGFILRAGHQCSGASLLHLTRADASAAIGTLEYASLEFSRMSMQSIGAGAASGQRKDIKATPRLAARNGPA